ncbi:MAG: helix-turn-helix domain-containing protein [Bacteroidetes bacterium]|nr:helix-turn-helix domain-containing protein [Bacteroidota bacterium]
MAIHMGKLVKERLEKVGMKKSELARRINRTSQNIYNIFKRETIDLEMLEMLGTALNYDFLAIYNRERDKLRIAEEDHRASYGEDKAKARIEKNLNTCRNLLERCTQERNHLLEEIKLLKEINDLLREKLEAYEKGKY